MLSSQRKAWKKWRTRNRKSYNAYQKKYKASIKATSFSSFSSPYIMLKPARPAKVQGIIFVDEFCKE